MRKFPGDSGGQIAYYGDRTALVKAMRQKGMSDGQILTAITRAEVRSERVRIVKEWARELDLSEAEALDLAKREAII